MKWCFNGECFTKFGFNGEILGSSGFNGEIITGILPKIGNILVGSNDGKWRIYEDETFNKILSEGTLSSTGWRSYALVDGKNILVGKENGNNTLYEDSTFNNIIRTGDIINPDSFDDWESYHQLNNNNIDPIFDSNILVGSRSGNFQLYDKNNINSSTLNRGGLLLDNGITLGDGGGLNSYVQLRNNNILVGDIDGNWWIYKLTTPEAYPSGNLFETPILLSQGNIGGAGFGDSWYTYIQLSNKNILVGSLDGKWRIYEDETFTNQLSNGNIGFLSGDTWVSYLELK